MEIRLAQARGIPGIPELPGQAGSKTAMGFYEKMGPKSRHTMPEMPPEEPTC